MHFKRLLSLTIPGADTQFLLARQQMVRTLTVGTGVAALVYVLVGLVTLLRTLMYPWDGLWVLLVSVGCHLLAQRSVSLSAAWFLAGVAQPGAYATQFYGIASPASVWLLLTILVCGLLVGRTFLLIWTIMMCGWILLSGIGELNGVWQSANPIADLPMLLQFTGLWWTLLIGTALLTGMFATVFERAYQVARGQTAALTTTLDQLQSAELDDVIAAALTALAHQLQAPFVTLWLHQEGMVGARAACADGQMMEAAALAGVVAPPAPPAEIPLWQELLRSRTPLVIQQPANDRRVRKREQVQRDGIATSLYVPLMLGTAMIGLFNVNTTTPRYFRPEELELATALGQQLTMALHLAELAQRAQQATLIDERNRMAREIHDTLAQGFTGIVVQLEAAEDALDDQAVADAGTHIERAKQLARTNLTEARRSVWNLRPEALEQRSLPDALRLIAARAVQGSAMTAQVVVEGAHRQLTTEVEDNLLRIAQEALTNAVKHSQGTQVMVTLSYLPAATHLTIADDGPGLTSPQPTHGFGLVSMRERAAQIGASFSIQTTTDGTVVRCEREDGAI